VHSLYWRIFCVFWLALALILIGTVTVAVNVSSRAERPWVQRGQMFAQAARAFESGGPAALRTWLQGLQGEPFSRTFVVDPSGKELLDRRLPQYLSGGPDTLASRSAANIGPIAPVGGALVLVGADGGAWHVVVGPVRENPRLFGQLELPGVPLAIVVIALIVSAALCFVLARHLAAPVDRLRLATRRMAGGDLSVRVLPALKGRQDDLGLLAADLDSMAQRLSNQLESKQQLLRDVSHELRSPLARLQLALSLAEREKGDSERHLTRIASEADRLEQLIARTLQLARLERPAGTLDREPVNVGDLLRTIAADVAIEADAQGCLVSVSADNGMVIAGDAELLRSAFENVIRNAVRYSPPGSMVSVSARRMLAASGELEAAEVIVRDHGPGVPEKDLKLIFEPFYRVEAAREHRSGGGEGLGLAIAARAVTLHGGGIEARNLQGGGLAVSITLPFAQGARTHATVAAA
jgi:two-component system sensor histidine kinase CpxA